MLVKEIVMYVRGTVVVLCLPAGDVIMIFIENRNAVR